MTINTLFLMSFLQGYEQLPHQDDVASIGAVGAAAARHVGVIHTGIKQDGLQCVCQFLRGVVRYHAGKRGHVVFRFHGSILLFVWFDFGKLDGKLTFVALAAQFGAAVFKPCLYFLHSEKLAAHVPLSFPVAERLGIIAYQSVERVHGLSESLAVVVATYPLLAPRRNRLLSFTISSPLAMRTRSVSTLTLKRASSHWAKRIAMR